MRGVHYTFILNRLFDFKEKALGDSAYFFGKIGRMSAQLLSAQNLTSVRASEIYPKVVW
jgi:hypothetical protein